MAIDVKKINIVLPEGVTKKGEISLKGNIAELEVVGATVGQKEISANYDGGVSKSVTLTVTDVTVFQELVTEPAGEVVAGGEVKLIAKFSKAPVLSELAIQKANGFTVKEEAKVVGNNIEATYTAGDVAMENCEFTANFRTDTTVKSARINILEKPAVLSEVQVEHAEIRIGAKSKVTAVFDKAPKIGEVQVVVPEGLTKDGEPALEGKNVVVTVTGKVAGAQKIQVTHNKVTKENTITVVSDAVIATATPEPAEVEVGGTSVVTVAYDKAFVTGQDALGVQYGEGLAEKVAYAENPEHNGGTLTVTVGAEGAKTLTLTLGGQQKVVTITGTPKPIVQAVDADPKSVEQGGTSKVKVTLK